MNLIKIIAVFALAAAAAAARADDEFITVEGSTAEITSHDKAAFRESNNIASADGPPNFLIRIDTSPTTSYVSGARANFFAADAELKVLKGRTLAYWYSTISGARESGYLKNPKRDPGARAWFQTGDSWNYDTREWIPFVPEAFGSIAEQAASLTARSLPEINGIIIQPGAGGKLLDGTDVSAVWGEKNPDLRPTVLRFDAATYEQSAASRPKWTVAAFNSTYQAPAFGEYVFKKTDLSDSDWTAGSNVSGVEILTGGLPEGFTRGVKITSKGSLGYSSQATTGFYNPKFPEIVRSGRYLVVVSGWFKKDSASLNTGTVYVGNYSTTLMSVNYSALTANWQFFSRASVVYLYSSYKGFGIIGGASSSAYNTVCVTGLTIFVKEIM